MLKRNGDVSLPQLVLIGGLMIGGGSVGMYAWSQYQADNRPEAPVVPENSVYEGRKYDAKVLKCVVPPGFTIEKILNHELDPKNSVSEYMTFERAASPSGNTNNPESPEYSYEFRPVEIDGIGEQNTFFENNMLKPLLQLNGLEKKYELEALKAGQDLYFIDFSGDGSINGIPAQPTSYSIGHSGIEDGGQVVKKSQELWNGKIGEVLYSHPKE